MTNIWKVVFALSKQGHAVLREETCIDHRRSVLVFIKKTSSNKHLDSAGLTRKAKCGDGVNISVWMPDNTCITSSIMEEKTSVK